METAGRGRAFRRAQRDRMIARRLRIAADVWHTAGVFSGEEGRLDKYNLVCPCWVCQISRRSGRAFERRSTDARKYYRFIKKCCDRR